MFFTFLFTLFRFLHIFSFYVPLFIVVFPLFLILLSFPLWPQDCICFAFLAPFYCSLVAFFPNFDSLFSAFFSDSGLPKFLDSFWIFFLILLFSGFPEFPYLRHNRKKRRISRVWLKCHYCYEA